MISTRPGRPKETTDRYLALDVRDLHREGLLDDFHDTRVHWPEAVTLYGAKVAPSVRIRTMPPVDEIIFDYRDRERCYFVKLVWTPCNLGGKRPWFLCPMPDCGKRIAILYGGNVFICRHCLRLAYQSTRETDYDRAARRANRIREKLGWKPGIFNDTGARPKGMHRRTFERLVAQHDASMRDSMRRFESPTYRTTAKAI